MGLDHHSPYTMVPNPNWSPIWFEYCTRVQPRHTDYAGVVWHGSYIEWMEAARIDALRSVGLEYVDLVKEGCDLPVIDLSLRYQQAMWMEDTVIVRSRLNKVEKIRLSWDQHIFTANRDQPCILGQVTLVPLNSESKRILRKFPPRLQDAVSQMSSKPSA
ncbi:thioesterase family protein [Acaryochloris sp. IP29b_bin.148]|uniref:acyl-CoA thioesterase n=1 Tax=Acaryochloris sp. IP29b_bin.148 TaxID=2969218 RepID=UPI00262A3019|nr:thioesterase family protein [Acaryochloris sp. IP29b_bin.148]